MTEEKNEKNIMRDWLLKKMDYRMIWYYSLFLTLSFIS